MRLVNSKIVSHRKRVTRSIKNVFGSGTLCGQSLLAFFILSVSGSIFWDSVLSQELSRSSNSGVEASESSAAAPNSSSKQWNKSDKELVVIKPKYFHEDPVPVVLSVVRPGEELVYQIRVTNPYEFTLLYDGFKAGCACTSIAFAPKLLLPHESTLSTVIVKSSKSDSNQQIKFVFLFHKEMSAGSTNPVEGYASEHTWLVRARQECSWSHSGGPVRIGESQGSEAKLLVINYTNRHWFSPYVELESDKVSVSTELSEENIDGETRQISTIILKRTELPASDGFDEKTKIKLFAKDSEHSELWRMIDTSDFNLVQQRTIEVIPKDLFVNSNQVEPLQLFLISHDTLVRFDSAQVQLIVKGKTFPIEFRKISDRWLSVLIPPDKIQDRENDSIVYESQLRITAGEKSITIDLPLRK